ncbi:MAG: HAMP domain-containing histidine kinase [candidate division Zixibacteria bacterium]|nr:HAMP domain-containing histidine kinase [candidate division Zixibacteria bacterium]
MSDTNKSEMRVKAPCAVCKIDLRGRFVYIDDEIEELLGESLEELFGKSINEYISSPSRQKLDEVISCHNRYESFYESLNLSIRLKDGQLHLYDTVITLNFIGGNPVNYQLILLPPKEQNSDESCNLERRFLHMIDGDIDDIPLPNIVELFCRAGGYARGDVYLPNDRGDLESAGSYPQSETGFAAPAYIELFSLEPSNRYSFRSEDRALHEGFGDSRTEAVLFLTYKSSRLTLSLQSPIEYLPPQSCIEDVELFANHWNERFKEFDLRYTFGKKFSLTGQVASSQGVMLAIANDNFDILYCNDLFNELLEKLKIEPSLCDITRIYEKMGILDSKHNPLSFEASPFALTTLNGELSTKKVRFGALEESVIISCAPLMVEDSELFVYSLTSLPQLSNSESGHQDFILNVAHDLKAPIITIDAFSRRLEKYHSNELSENGKFAVNCILENTNILGEMVSGIEDLSRNWLSDEPKIKFATSTIIKELVEQLRAHYPDSDYSVQLPSRLPQLTAPLNRFTTVIKNILDNAFKYSARVKLPSIELEYSFKDERHTFTVSDNGTGIASKYQAKVFEPFFRDPDVLEIPGTGIGLAITRDIVNEWGGTIEIETKESQGTRISFSLP